MVSLWLSHAAISHGTSEIAWPSRQCFCRRNRFVRHSSILESSELLNLFLRGRRRIQHHVLRRGMGLPARLQVRIFFISSFIHDVARSTPASQAFIYDLTNLEYLIGGRNILTGKVLSNLDPLAPYYVRVTAFNVIGAGIAGYAPGPITLRDEPPLPPRSLSMFPLDATQLYASWNYPLRDGGATLEKYRFEYSTNANFSSYTAVDLPLVEEVQVVSLNSPVVIETQTVTLVAQVTNEQQVVRSTLIPAVDEIQTVTVFCDDVVNEVQRVVTTAIDVNELQSVELTGTEVHEIQVVQSYVSGVSEVQVVDVSSPVVDEVQTFGVIVTGIDTSSCSVGNVCAAVESQLSGYYRLQFDPNQCGTYSDKVESNWCVIALNAAGIT